MNDNIIVQDEYSILIKELKARIRSASIKAIYKVNSEMISLYFDMGKYLSEKVLLNQKLEIKFNVVNEASKDLIAEFGKGEGYSARNLQYMIKLYNEYKGKSELQRLVAVVPWGSNCLILDSNLNDSEKEFYLKYSINSGCVKSVLSAQIKTKLSERSKQELQSNFITTIPSISEQANEIVKDSYVLQIVDPHNILHERHLENKLIESIKDFLMELGSDFTYIGNQYQVNLDGDSNFIDLLFFNRKLKCLFAIDLKVTEFIPEFVGKMQYYLELLDTQIKLPHENQSIGIILCTEKNKLKVEATLKRSNSPIAVATYDIVAKLEKKIPEILRSIEENGKL